MRCVAFGADEVRTALRRCWQCSPSDCVPLAESPWRVDGGGGSDWPHSWRVSVGAQLFLARHLPLARRAQFEAGLRAAERLESNGIAAGEPVRAADGALTVATEGGGFLALLRWVPGRPLHGDDPIDQQWWGDTLATVHRVLAGFTHPGLARFYSVHPEAPHLSLEDWLRPAVQAAVTAVRKLCVTDQLTYGVLHGDPSPDEFRLDPETGRIGLVEWGCAGTGPLVYDVAAAVLFAGGAEASAELLDGYFADAAAQHTELLPAGAPGGGGVGPVTPHPAVSKEECAAALPTMLRFRAAVLADRFAARLFAAGGVHCGPAADRAALRAAGLVLRSR
jgi:hypothetical protein